MIKNNPFIIMILFLLPSITIGQTEADLKLIVENATYRKGQRSFQMDVYWENKGTDTLFVIQPQSSHFDGDILKNGDLIFVGEVQKPYHLTLTQGGECPTIETIHPSSKSPKLFHLYDFHVVTVPPGQRSQKFVASFAAEQRFCPEVQYSVQISYDPQYTTISEAQKEAIEKRKKAYDELMKEVSGFLKEQEIETMRHKPSTSLMHTIWDNDNIIQSLIRTKVSSETIAVVKQ